MKKCTTFLASLVALILVSNVALVKGASATAAEDYYRQFMYVEEVINDGNGEVFSQWRWLMSQSEVQVNDLKKIMVDSNMVLLPKDEYLFAVSETVMTRTSKTAPWVPEFSPTGFCPTVLKGTWSAPVGPMIVSSPELNFDQAVFDGRASAKVMFKAKILSPEITGTEATFDYGYSNTSMESLLSRGGFCPL